MAESRHILHWTGRIFSAEDVRRSLNGHRELVLSPRAIVTPLAADELRAKGVQITRKAQAEPKIAMASWGYAQDRSQPLVETAVKALERDGFTLRNLQLKSESSACRWARAVAECVAGGECKGGVVFCQDAGLFCCVANKLPGLRSAAVSTVAQTGRAVLTLGANLLAVEMPGRSFFELRQILRTFCSQPESICPPGLACTLQELEGNAHR